MKSATISRGCPGMGSTTRGAGDRAAVQRNALRQGLCLVLAEDCGYAHIETSLARYHLRQLRDHSRWSRATLRLLSVLRSVTYIVRVATATAGRASLRWRDTRRFDRRYSHPPDVCLCEQAHSAL